jgi:hypothetical protein
MSDYLGNLAARSLDPAGAAVRPRLASRFEPDAPWAAPVAAEPASLDAIEEAAVTPVRKAAPASPEVEEPVSATRRRQGRKGGEVEASPEVDQDAKRLAPLASAPVVPVPVSTVPSQSFLAHRGGLPFEASPPDPLSTGVERGKETVLREPVGHALRADRDGAHSAPYGLAIPEKAPLSTRVERGGGEVSERIPSAGRLTSKGETLPVLQPRVTLVEPPPSPAHREAPAPTIHVSIGRIEVRASPAPKAPVRERLSAPAAVSLEDYLRRRSKGGEG